MVIFINDKETQVNDDTLVSTVVEQLNLKPNGLAIAVNDSIVKQSDWGNTSLNANDQVLLISATKGG